MSKIKIAVAGCLGRMGQEITQQVLQDKRFVFIGGFEHKKHPKINKKISDIIDIKSNLIVSDNADKIIKEADVVIDFTTPQSTLSNIKKASLTKTAYIVGTTGINLRQTKTIKSFSKRIPILMSSNMSLGVNTLFGLVQQTAAALKDIDYDIEISETHHKYKIDAPSGTALSLGEFAARGRKTNLQKIKVFDRTAKKTVRKMGNIGFSVTRGGEIVGEHTVSFIGINDRIDLVHKANNRCIFVLGAIEAAAFTVKKKNGFFDMKDFLFRQ